MPLPDCEMLITPLSRRILLAVLFLKHVVFEDPNAAKRERERRKRAMTGGTSETDGEAGGLEDGARRKRDRKGKGKVRGRSCAFS